MTTSGSFKTSSYDGRHLVFAWSVKSQSTAENKTTIAWTLKSAGTASVTWYLCQNIKVTLNGDAVFVHTKDANGQIKIGPDTSITSGEYTFTHNDEGNCSFTGYVEAGIYVWAVNCTGSETFDLPQIARSSEISSAGAVTLGNPCSVKWTPGSASFRYKLKFSLEDWSYTTGVIHPNKTTAYTYTGYTIPLSVAKQIPESTTGEMTVYLYTYSDSSGTKQVGSADSAKFTVTVPDNSSTRPTVSMELAPISDLPDTFAGLYIQGQTKVKATLSASGKYDATIKSYSMKAEGKSYGSGDSYTSDYLSKYGSIEIDGYAKDSRGYTGSTSKTISVIAYGKPQIIPANGETDVIAARCDQNGKLTDSGTFLIIKAMRSYSKVISGGVQKNFCKIRYRYKVEDGSYSSWVTILAANAKDSDEVNTGALLNGALSPTSTYLVQIQAIDDIGENSSTTITIATDKVYMHRDGKRNALGIGKYVEDNNTVDIAEDIILKARGPIEAMGGGNIDTLTLGRKLIATAASPIRLGDYKTPGNYYSPNGETSQHILDTPYTAGGFGMTVRYLQTTGFIRQELFYARTTWIRHYDGTDWSDWWRYQTTTVPETASADYVIETGVSNGWTYKKWKGGTYEAFGTFKVKPSESSKNESLYRTNNMTIPLPFQISSAYVSGTVVGYYWITNGGISGDSAVTLRLMSDKAFSTSSEIEVRLTVMGIYE